MNWLAVLYVTLAILLLSGCAQPAGGQPRTPPPQPTPAQSPQPTSPGPTAAPQPTASPTGGVPATPSPTAAAQPGVPSPTGQPAGQGAVVPAGAEPLVEKAKQDAARKAGVSPDQVTVVSVKAVQWPDSSLGCPQPGFMYSQVVTPGYLIVLSAGGKTYEYHSDRGQQVVTCANPRPPLSADQ